MVYQTYVLSVALHGLDCITWIQQLSDSIEVFQNHVMRFITSHRLIDKIRISALCEKTSLPPPFGKIKSKTLKLFGHVKRSTLGLSKLCFEGMVQGKRSRGRPRHRWRENIPSWSGIHTWDSINQAVLDRAKWKQLNDVNSQPAYSRNSDT